MLIDQSCREFSNNLSSKAPVPGGGGVAAMLGALGTALCQMAGNLTVGKKKYAEFDDDNRRIIDEAEKIRLRFLELVDEDAAVFEPLSKAYSIPKTDPSYQSTLREATLNACMAPYDMMKCCCDALDLLEELSGKCSVLMISDVGCAALSLKAALESAAMNVYVNTRSLPEEESVVELEADVEKMLLSYSEKAQKIADSVMDRLRLKKILRGAPVAAALTDELSARSAALKEKGVTPKLLILRVGEGESSKTYENNAINRCKKIGIEVESIILSEDCSQAELIETIEKINHNDKIHACLMLRPLPSHLDEQAACEALLPSKDVDSMTSASLNGVFIGTSMGFAPCTAQSCIEILDHYGFDLSGKNVAVIGRSLVIGRPVSMMLQARNATVTMCHTKTVGMADTCKKADILIAAAGQAKVIDENFVNPNQIVIDVGINVDKDGKLCGDVNFDRVMPIVKAISPVPGGVGTVTTAVLCKHVIEAAEKKAN